MQLFVRAMQMKRFVMKKTSKTPKLLLLETHSILVPENRVATTASRLLLKMRNFNLGIRRTLGNGDFPFLP